MYPNPTLFDLMEMKPQHYLNGKNWIQMRQGYSGESGVSWPVTPTGLLYGPIGSSTLVSLPTWSDLQAWHRVNDASIRITTRDGKLVSWKREHLPQSVYSWLLYGFYLGFLCSVHRGLQVGWGSDVLCCNWYSFLGSSGATDTAMIRATVTAFF